MLLLQTSDWHLGRTMLGRSLISDQAHVLDQVVEIVQDRRPELVLIVGDLFERSSPQDDAEQLFDSTISRLVLDCKVRVVIIPGQHDNASRLAMGSRLVDKRGLQVITGIEQALSPLSLEDADGPLHLITLPYIHPQIVARHFRGRQVQTWGHAATLVLDHLTRFRRLRKKAVRGLVAAYVQMEGGQTCGPERPIGGALEAPVPTSIFEGISYGAFGYYHREQRLGEELQLCYSGSILPYSFDEADQTKCVLLTEVNAEGAARTEAIPLRPLRRLHQLEGTLPQILATSDRVIGPNDLVRLKLTTEIGPIPPETLDVLRRMFPNLVAIERPVLRHDRAANVWSDTATLFEAFYQQATGNVMEVEERAQLLTAIGEASS